MAEEFARLGISSIGFDYSGAGSSTSNTPSSIVKRTQEAERALALLDTQKPIILCGFSMSGQIIINLLNNYTNISYIILGAP
jgi:alpha-beta hydrolase superfamily lysophospholipase